MHSPPVGRSEIWRELIRPLEQRRSALVLVQGPPGSGRLQLVSALGVAAHDQGYRTLGCDDPIPIDVTTRLGDLQRILTSTQGADEPGLPASPLERGGLLGRVTKAARDLSRDDAGVLAALRAMAPALIAVDGYAPSAGLHAWLVARLLPAVHASTEPLVLVVLDRRECLDGLRPTADLSIDLGPLDRDEVARHLVNSTPHLVPPLSDEEITAYAAAAAEDPGVLAAFDAVFAAVDPRGIRGPRR